MAAISWNTLMHDYRPQMLALADKYQKSTTEERQALIANAAKALNYEEPTLRRRLVELLFYREHLMPELAPAQEVSDPLSKEDAEEDDALEQVEDLFYNLSTLTGKAPPPSRPTKNTNPPTPSVLVGGCDDDIQLFLQSLSFPDPTKSIFEDEPYITLTGDEANNFIVCGDWEIPDYDPLTVLLMMAYAAKTNIRTLVINGDFFAMDIDYFTAWRREYRRTGELNFKGIHGMGRRILWTAFEWFDNIYMITGNHDARVNKATGGEITWDIMTENTDAKTSQYYYMYAESKNGPILINHPTNYSKKQLDVPVEIETLEERHCHIISSHTHHCAIGHTKNGMYRVMEPGCVRRHALYKDLKKAKYPRWVNGFGVVKNGFMDALPVRMTDWEDKLGHDIYHAVAGNSLFSSYGLGL